MYAGGISKGDVLMTMLDDLGDLFEQSATAGTSVREIVGDEPVEFVETFLANYSDGQWIDKERTRLNAAIHRAEQMEAGT
jgi:DNA-binding ferritin-like protein (Dps family)